MKALRFVLVALFAASLFLVAAPAQASSGAVGWEPLVTHSNSKAPIYFQARSGFESLLPALMQARKSGLIREFTPNFKAGVLEIHYSGSNVLSLGGVQAYRMPSQALALVPHQKPSIMASKSSSTTQFYFELYDDNFEAYIPVGAHIVGSLRNAAGVIVNTYEGNDGDDGVNDGYLSNYFWNGPYGDILPGYTITFKVYDTYPNGTLLGTYSTTAPNFTFTGLNKSTAVVQGTGPKNHAYFVYWSEELLNATDQYIGNGFSGTTSSAGAWSKDVYGGALRGGAYVDVDFQQTAYMTFSRDMWAPDIYCQLATNYCTVYSLPRQAVSLTVTHSGVKYSFSGVSDAWGDFYADVVNGSGVPIFLQAGDKVQGTNVALYTEPKLTASINFTSDVVSGLAPASKYFSLYVWGYTPGWNWYWVGSNSSGAYSEDVSAYQTLLPSESSYAYIYYVDPATGNETSYNKAYGP
jgi:hypothetical protein